MNGRTSTHPLRLVRFATLAICFAALLTGGMNSVSAAPQKRSQGNPLEKLPATNECPAAVKAEHANYVDTLKKVCTEPNVLKKKLEEQYKKSFPHCITSESLVRPEQQGESEAQLRGAAQTAAQFFERGAKLVGMSIYKPMGNVSRFSENKFSERFGSLAASMTDICLRLKLAAKDIGKTCLAYATPKLGENASEQGCTHLNAAPRVIESGQALEFRRTALLNCRSKEQKQNLAVGLNRARWNLKDPKEDERAAAERKGAPPRIEETFIKPAEKHYREFHQNFMIAREKVSGAHSQNQSRMHPDVRKKFDQLFDQSFKVCDKLGSWVATDLHNAYINQLIKPMSRLDDVFYTAERNADGEAKMFALNQAVAESRRAIMGQDLAAFGTSNAVANDDPRSVARKFGDGYRPVTFQGSEFNTPAGADGKPKRCRAQVNEKTMQVAWPCVPVAN